MGLRIVSERLRTAMSDISTKELDKLHDEIDADINRNGLYTDEELKVETEEYNETALVRPR